MVDRRPALIARCASIGDVVAALRYGREHDLEIGVRGGGHSVAGLAVPEGGLMIDLSPMNAVRVDPGARRAWVGGGALLGALDQAAQRYGLATTAGNVSHTGVGGLTLGGGTGWLARRLGLSCDSVASYEVVTAAGAVVRATATDHPDLFWALRGGSGNFGVVTGFEFRLHPVGVAALVVDVAIAPADAFDAVRRWRDLLAGAPRPATMVARASQTPTIGYVWVGDPREGVRLLPALRAAAGPRVTAEQVEEMSYLDLQRRDDDVETHALRRYWKHHYFRDLPDAAVAAFLARDPGDGLPTNGRLTGWGGAITDIAAGESAFGHRDALAEFTTAAGWTSPAQDTSRIAGTRNYARTLEPYASGIYLNALADEGDAGVQRAYGQAPLPRLIAVKDRYDPDNVFHLNPNIRPSREASSRAGGPHRRRS
jgi:FAD/FMN-containing dehydrogenase